MDKKNILVLAIVIINIPFFIGVMMLIEKAFEKNKEVQTKNVQMSTWYSTWVENISWYNFSWESTTQ